MGAVDSDDEYDAVGCEGGYVAVKPPELPNGISNILLNTLSSAGIRYGSLQGKGEEAVRSTSSDDPMGGNPDFDIGLASTLEAAAPDALEHPISDEGCFQIDPVLLANVCHPAKRYSHIIFQAKKTWVTEGYVQPTAVYFYQLLCSSQDPQLEHAHGLVGDMLPRLQQPRALCLWTMGFFMAVLSPDFDARATGND